MYYYLNIVILLKFVLLFAVCFIDVYSGCCKDNSKIKTINCEENKKSISLGLGGGGNDELVQKDASAVNDTIEISEIPIINDHSNGLQAKQISDIREDFYGYSYKILPCLSYRDKFDLLYVLKGVDFVQESHKDFINEVVNLLEAGKILRFCKSMNNVDYSEYNKDAYNGNGSEIYENVIWFFDTPTIVSELVVNLENRKLLLKRLNKKICYFNVFTKKRNFRPEDKMYNFTDFTNDNNVKEVLGEKNISDELLLGIRNLKFDLSPEALFK